MQLSHHITDGSVTGTFRHCDPEGVVAAVFGDAGGHEGSTIGSVDGQRTRRACAHSPKINRLHGTIGISSIGPPFGAPTMIGGTITDLGAVLPE